MAERYYTKERHHTMWERRAYSTPLEKRLRLMAAFIIDVPHPNHRLIHASLNPPTKPDVDTLRKMESLASRGLEVVMDRIEHPYIRHLQSQLEIATMDSDEAMDRIDSGLYWQGYGARVEVPRPDDVFNIVKFLQHDIAQDFSRLPYTMGTTAYEDEAFSRLEERVMSGVITRAEADAAMAVFTKVYCGAQ